MLEGADQVQIERVAEGIRFDLVGPHLGDPAMVGVVRSGARPWVKAADGHPSAPRSPIAAAASSPAADSESPAAPAGRASPAGLRAKSTRNSPASDPVRAGASSPSRASARAPRRNRGSSARETYG